LEKDNEKKLKDHMQNFIQQTKEERDIEKQERVYINKFISQPDVAKIFSNYDRQLKHMYKFYSSMDSKKETSFDLDYLHNMLSLKEFVRFGYQ